jgi:hypothetical protein
MNHRFLSDEAARFRGMAADAEREATKVRLLAMAADYESRARIAGDATESNQAETIKMVTEPDQAEATEVVAQPDQGEAIKPQVGRKITREPKDGVLAERRPVGRPRLSLPSN